VSWVFGGCQALTNSDFPNRGLFWHESGSIGEVYLTLIGQLVNNIQAANARTSPLALTAGKKYS
jgi:hypothetical protein